VNREQARQADHSHVTPEPKEEAGRPRPGTARGSEDDFPTNPQQHWRGLSLHVTGFTHYRHTTIERKALKPGRGQRQFLKQDIRTDGGNHHKDGF
jgi:hypothetical protein